MSAFVGTWDTLRYRFEDPDTPEAIELTVTQDAQPENGTLDGAYPRPGFDARMHGRLSDGGGGWTAEFDESTSSGDYGTVQFIVSPDGTTLYGAWRSQMYNGGPQLWIGVRR